MREILLVKNGEIALKGLNRSTFEDMLVKNIKYRLSSLGKISVTKAQSTIVVTPKYEDYDLDEACERLKKVFGIATFSRCLVTEKDLDVIKKEAIEYLRDLLPYTKTFKVAAKRSDKHFPYNSPQLQQELGGALLSAYPTLKVDVHNPEVTVTVEIREEHAYVHASVVKGAGGMPIGSSGKGLLLVSGGIDSPVAGYMMARRGLKLSAMHFVSPPYTSDRALQKVVTLCEKVTEYSGDMDLYVVPFTKLQVAIRDNCPEELFTIIMRRLMMELANRLCEREDIPAIITGESLGQVASQTVYALSATNAAADYPVFRPLIGMDKRDIVEIARDIDTFETSILPYEDCCTVFTPKRPKTRPTLKFVEEAQNSFDFEPLLKEAFDGIELKQIKMER